MLPLAVQISTGVQVGFVAKPAAGFARDERGAVGMIFALSMFAVIMFLACAIDIGRASMARTKIAGAVDAASIYAAKELKSSGMALSSIEPMARAFFDFNMKGAKLAIVNDFKLTSTPDGNGVTVDVKSEVPTTFARIAGINKMDLVSTATAIFNTQDIEVGLQLDVTGSMGDSIKGKKKIDSLKVATTNLLNILLPDGGTGTTKVRVGIAPFSAGVNAGSYAKSVAGGSAPGNCVYERKTSFADTTDDAPIGGEALKTKNDLPSGIQSCPGGAQVAALSADKSSLLPTVNALTPGGSTAGHLGTGWAWYLVSPKWANVWPTASKPADYNDGKTLKFTILMTDGIYNTVGGVDLGDYSSTASDSQSRAKNLCDAMKAKGIVVYSVGFIAAGDPPAAADTLKYCATGSTHFYKAENGDELDAAFRNIAADISRLRLSK